MSKMDQLQQRKSGNPHDVGSYPTDSRTYKKNK